MGAAIKRTFWTPEEIWRLRNAFGRYVTFTWDEAVRIAANDSSVKAVMSTPARDADVRTALGIAPTTLRELIRDSIAARIRAPFAGARMLRCPA